MPDYIEQLFTHLARWVKGYGWLEIGQDHYTGSFIRVLDEGGMIWQGDPQYETLDAALHAAEVAVAQWMWQQLGER